MRYFIVIAAFFYVLGCTSKAVRIADVNAPLSTLSRAIKAGLPVGAKRVYQDGKRFQSHYFKVGKNKFLKALHSKTRFYADILIRGDRRPYSVEITVVKQEKVTDSSVTLKTYTDVGTDPRKAELIKRIILKELSKRREDLDVIDDFRVF